MARPTSAPAPTTPAAEKRDTKRFSMPLDAAGNPDFESMRDETRDKLRSFLQDDGVRSRLRVEPTGPAAPAPELPPGFGKQIAGPLVRSCELITLVVASKISDRPVTEINVVCRYTAEEKEQMAEPIAVLLNKYGGTILTKYGEWVALAAVFATITMGKIQAAEDSRVRETATIIPIRPVEAPAPAPVPDAPEPAPALI